MSRLAELPPRARTAVPQPGADLEAQNFPNDCRRIETLTETGLLLCVLDLTKARVRKTIRDVESASALYEWELASDY